MKNLTKCYCGHTTTCDCGPEEPKQEDMITKIMQMDAKMAYDSLPKQETLEEAAKDYIENTMKFSFNSLETKTQANRMLKCIEFGAKWQQEQDKLDEDSIRLDERCKCELENITTFSEGYDAGISQQERSYSEEDMISFAHFYFVEKFNSTMRTSKSTDEILQEWFEQFKKK